MTGRSSPEDISDAAGADRTVSNGDDLRRRAERIADEERGLQPKALEPLSIEAARGMIHELRVHQIELEMQNQELRRTQEELEASRARYFELYDLAPVGYLTVSEAGLIRGANLRASEMLGTPRVDLVGMPFSRFILPAYQDTHYLHRRRLLAAGGSQVYELRLARADGAPFWARLEASVAIEEGSPQAGDATRVLRIALSDITAAVEQADRALRESEARATAVFEGATIGMALLDIEGSLLATNPALRRLVCCDGTGMENAAFQGLFEPEDGDPVGPVARGEVPVYHAERRYRRRDGEWGWAMVTVSRVPAQAGRVAYLLGMLSDTSDARKALEALVHAERLTVVGKLAATLAHEVNNPLQSVVGCLGLVCETLPEDSEAGRYLRMAHSEALRASRLVRRFRNLSRTGEDGERVEPVSVADLVEETLSISAHFCQRAGVTCEWQPGEGLPEVAARRDALKQVFLNLTMNAIEAMHQRGTLTVRAAVTAEPLGVSVSFQDTGEGIPANKLETIFETFYTTKRDGLGLGLGVCRSIVAEHGGRIDVQSQVGQGSTFTVWLPA